jgi:6-phosphogluconolactonase (cycloisomerase 2 family)
VAENSPAFRQAPKDLTKRKSFRVPGNIPITEVCTMFSGNIRLKLFGLLSAATALTLLTSMASTGLAQGRTGDVYVLTNQTSDNSILVFHRDPAGGLTFAGSFPSGGNGAGGTGADPLGSQNSVVLSRDGRLLFAVNAGSNSISVFGVSGDQLILLNTAPSGGTMPVSLAVQDSLVYAVNAGGTPNISGFTIQPATNHLSPLPGSTQNLLGGATAGPAQVSFNSDGSALVVTEKGTNLIDTFVLNENGIAQPGVSFTSSGTVPFGFAFTHDNVAVVSDAAGGPSGTSALSSYHVADDGDLSVITPALGDTQKAACWVVVPENGRFAYTSNTASGTISSYTISEDGNLELLDATAASGKVPLDMAFSIDSRFLYARNFGDGTIRGFSVGSDGSLTPVTTVGGLPAGATGLAARQPSPGSEELHLTLRPSCGSSRSWSC